MWQAWWNFKSIEIWDLVWKVNFLSDWKVLNIWDDFLNFYKVCQCKNYDISVNLESKQWCEKTTKLVPVSLYSVAYSRTYIDRGC